MNGRSKITAGGQTTSRHPKDPSHAAVAALFRDRPGRLLCVKPTYRSGWLVPGGILEEGELPLEACRREVEEELGLGLEPGRLLCVEHRQASPREESSAQFVFWGAELSSGQIGAIRLPPEELSEYRLLEVDSASEILIPSLARRVRIALAALQDDTTLLVHGATQRVTVMGAAETRRWLATRRGGQPDKRPERPRPRER